MISKVYVFIIKFIEVDDFIGVVEVVGYGVSVFMLVVLFEDYVVKICVRLIVVIIFVVLVMLFLMILVL